jgi:hypothetical protein
VKPWGRFDNRLAGFLIGLLPLAATALAPWSFSRLRQVMAETDCASSANKPSPIATPSIVSSAPSRITSASRHQGTRSMS